MWSLRITAARLRPLNGGAFFKIAIVGAVFALFLYGDFVLFRRLFTAMKTVESATPFFALAILRNLLSLVFLTATVVLFSSSLTAAIGAFFTDLDLDTYHAAPRGRLRIVVARWAKTLLQSATVVFFFLIPVFVAFASQYRRPPVFYFVTLANLALLLSIPVSLSSLTIVVLVRWFPVRRVHQIVTALAILVLTLTVIAFRMSRPERLFREISTDDLVAVLRAIELPAIGVYPSTALADVMVNAHSAWFPPKIALLALGLFIAFVAVATPVYFAAFVRARESMAPSAFGSEGISRGTDWLFSRFAPAPRALMAKEIRTVTRDVAQWSQVFLTVALLFIYLYNIRMMPLSGDARASIVAFANVGMAGFVVAAVSLRFAYPSVSAEGKAFWLIQAAPVRPRDLLRVKVLVYGVPLTFVAVFLTAVANVLLDANLTIWLFTMLASLITAATLVCVAVALGALAPDFNAENPLQVGLSLGGFAYMAMAMIYVGFMMLIMARPMMRYFLWKLFGTIADRPWISYGLPIVTAVTISLLLALTTLSIAERRLARLRQTD